MPDSDRHYSDKQTRKILRKAAELQRKAGVDDASTGLTLDEIQHIAEESGIDPRYVREAMMALDETDVEEGHPFFGGPLKLEYDRTFEGEISAEEMEERFVPPIREVLGIKGKFERLGNTLTFTHDENKDAVAHQVTIVAQNGKTHVRIVPRVWDWTFVFFMMPTFAAGMISLIITQVNDLTTGFGWSLFGVLSVLVFLFGRMGYKRFINKQRAKIQRLMAEIDTVVQEYAPARSQAPPEAAVPEAPHPLPAEHTPRITLEEEEEDPAPGYPTGRRRKTSA